MTRLGISLADLLPAAVVLMAVVFLSPVHFALANAPQLPLPPAQPADDEIAPLTPLRDRTETERDRLHGMSLYAAARMADQASNYSVALNLYVRAYRYDPQNIDSLKRAVLLARVLGRHTLAARHASELILHAKVDPLDLLRGIIYLRQEGRAAEALTAYEKTLADRGGVTVGPVFVELHKQAAELYLQAKKYPQAADAFDRVGAALKRPADHGLDPETLKLIQGDADALFSQMADAFLKAGRYKQAAEVFESAAKSSGDEGLALYGRARLAAAQQQNAEAIKLLDSYLEKKLTSQEAAPYRLLGEVLAAEKQPRQFRVKLQQALALDGENLPLGHFLAAQYLAEAQWAEARALYAKLLSRKPSTAAYRGLIDANRQDGQVGPLLTALGDAVGGTGGLSLIGGSFELIAADKPLMAKLVAEADRRFQDKPAELKYGPRLALALLSCEAKQFDVSGRFFELALLAEPQQKGALLTTWGLALIGTEQYEQAVDILQRALDERAVPVDNPALNFYLAGALSMVNRHDAALVAAHKAAIPDAAPELASRVGWVHYRAKKYDEARMAYTELIKRFGDVHDVPGARDVVREARLTLSHVYVLLGDMPQAEELLEQVLDEFPDNIGVRNDLGYLWAEQGRHLERSLSMIQQAVAAEPDNAAYRDSLGWVLYRLGRYDEAIAELTRAAAGEKPDGVVLDHLGDALDKAGRKTEAMDAWKRAVKKFDDEDAIKKKATEDKLRSAETSKGK